MTEWWRTPIDDQPRVALAYARASDTDSLSTSRSCVAGTQLAGGTISIALLTELKNSYAENSYCRRSSRRARGPASAAQERTFSDRDGIITRWCPQSG